MHVYMYHVTILHDLWFIFSKGSVETEFHCDLERCSRPLGSIEKCYVDGSFPFVGWEFPFVSIFFLPKNEKNKNTTTRAEDINEVSHLVESKTWLFSSSFMPWQHPRVAVFWPSAFSTTAVPLTSWKMLLQMRQRWRHFFNNWATGHVAPMWHEWCFFFFLAYSKRVQVLVKQSLGATNRLVIPLCLVYSPLQPLLAMRRQEHLCFSFIFIPSCLCPAAGFFSTLQDSIVLSFVQYSGGPWCTPKVWTTCSWGFSLEKPTRRMFHQAVWHGWRVVG